MKRNETGLVPWIFKYHCKYGSKVRVGVRILKITIIIIVCIIYLLYITVRRKIYRNKKGIHV